MNAEMLLTVQPLVCKEILSVKLANGTTGLFSSGG